MNYSEMKTYELRSKLETANRMISRYTNKRSDLVAKWSDIRSEVRGEMALRRKPDTGSFAKEAA